MAEREAEHKRQIDAERQQNADFQATEAETQARVVRTIGQALEQLAQGDSTVRCGDLGNRYAELRDNFNGAISQLERTMTLIKERAAPILASARKKSAAPRMNWRSVPNGRRQALRKPRRRWMN